MHDNIARTIADMEQTTTAAAAALLDAQIDLAIARHALLMLKRRLAAAEDLGTDDVRRAQADLTRARLDLTEVATLLMGGATRLITTVEETRSSEPPQPSQP